MGKIKETITQYGFCGFLIRSSKYLLKKIGISYESYYFLRKELADVGCDMPFSKKLGIEMRELFEIDFENSYNSKNYLNINKSKKDIIRKRFKHGGYRAFGAFEGDDLIYACWLSIDKYEIPGYGELLADENDCFLLDDYCAAHKRKKGIHKAVNHIRMSAAKNMDKKFASIVILKENIPALKTQMGNGFSIYFSFYSFSFFHRKRSNFGSKFYNS